MNILKILIVLVVFAGVSVFSSPAFCGLDDAEFFYGVKAGNHQGIKASDGSRKPLTTEVFLKIKKKAAALHDDFLRPEIFYGYKHCEADGAKNL